VLSGWTPEEIQQVTEPVLELASDLAELVL
jgi:hypothetical protein